MKLREVLLQNMVTHLLKICKSELGLTSVPEIQLLNTPLESESFGEFDGSVRVVAKDRHPVDVMRTLAHELTHYKQMMSGVELDGSDGSPDENEANAMAGIIMRKFAHEYPDYFVNALP
jgi:hypothetical protein